MPHGIPVAVFLCCLKIGFWTAHLALASRQHTRGGREIVLGANITAHLRHAQGGPHVAAHRRLSQRRPWSPAADKMGSDGKPGAFREDVVRAAHILG